MDTRFTPITPRQHCLNCRHGSLDPVADKVFCKHPARPHASADRSEVIRWAVGCPQHQPLEPQQ